MMSLTRGLALVGSLLLFTVGMPAHAYVGPGLGAGVLGVILGLLGSVLLALFAVFWYPIKRTLFGGKAKDEEMEEDEVAEVTEAVAKREDSSGT